MPTRRENGELSRINYSFKETHGRSRHVGSPLQGGWGRVLVHVFALAGDPNSESAWSRSKYEGELAVREENPDATSSGQQRCCMRIGFEHIWTSQSACLSRLCSSGERPLTQPVYALDVGKACSLSHNDIRSQGGTFQLAGPAEYSYKEIAEFVQDVTTVKKPLVDIPEFAATAAGNLLNETIEPLPTPDQVIQMKEDCVLKSIKV